MKKSIDVNYICTNIGNLSGIPVRLYENNKQSYYYSIVALPKDPFSLYENEVLALDNHVGYFMTPHNCYFGFVSCGEKRIVIGPTRQTPWAEQELHEMAFELDLSKAAIGDFLSAMKSIVQMPLMSVLQMMSIVNHVLNEGEKLSLEDIAIYNSKQELLQQKLAEEDAERTLASADEAAPPTHNTFDIENFLVNAIRHGDVAAIKDFFSKAPAVRAGAVASEELRQAKNTFIISATLFSRAAIRGGMAVEDALSLSDNYIQKIELLTSMDDITNMNYRLVMDYAERMEKLLYGNCRSKLVIEVNNYLRRHLSEPISVEKLARHLCRGRSRLSTDFKKETGENLSAFILKQKIEEGKKLLVYTDKPSVEIALYLGFSSQSHFSRTFKQYAGCTPNEYRLAQRNV